MKTLCWSLNARRRKMVIPNSEEQLIRTFKLRRDMESRRLRELLADFNQKAGLKQVHSLGFWRNTKWMKQRTARPTVVKVANLKFRNKDLARAGSTYNGLTADYRILPDIPPAVWEDCRTAAYAVKANFSTRRAHPPAHSWTNRAVQR